MKMSTIQKALVKQSIVLLAILGGIGAGVFAADAIDEDYIKQVADLKVQTDEIVKSVGALNSEYTLFKNNLDAYQKIQEKLANNMLTVNQDIARAVFANARKQYHFDNLKATVGAVTGREGKYKLQTTFVNATDMTLTMDGLTDEDIFGLMNAIQAAFSSINFTYLKMGMAGTVDKAVLQRVSQDGFSPVVSAEIKMTWAGLAGVNENTAESLLDDKTNPAAPTAGNRIRIKAP